MRDTMTPDQIRYLYAETIARARFREWDYDSSLWPAMSPKLIAAAMTDVDALAAKGLLPVHFEAMRGRRAVRYATAWQDPS